MRSTSPANASIDHMHSLYDSGPLATYRSFRPKLARRAFECLDRVFEGPLSCFDADRTSCKSLLVGASAFGLPVAACMTASSRFV